MGNFQAPAGTLSPGSICRRWRCVESERASDAVIVFRDHAEEISDGDFVPVHQNFGWLEGRRDVPATSPRTCKVPVDWSGMPLRQGCASRRNLPAAGAHLLDTSGDVGEGEGRFSSPVLKLMRPSSNSIFCRWLPESAGLCGP